MSGSMAAMKLLCYGDSNTYGFDPRSYIGGRYPAASRWPDLVAECTGYQVINAGMNGRMIPAREEELAWMGQMITGQHPDLVIIMLGINDLLCGASADEITGRMDACLQALAGMRILLIGPPPLQNGTWVPDDQLLQEAAGLSDGYRDLAVRRGISFADTRDWDVEVTYDGVHFSEEGHRAFARGICRALTDQKQG